MHLHDNSGYSIAELVTVLAVISVLMAVSAPSLHRWYLNSGCNSAARDLYGAMIHAKEEAVMRNINCAVTFNQQIGATTYTYIIYDDADTDCEYDPGETIIFQKLQLPTSVSFDPAQGGGDGLTFADNDDGYPTIVFRPNAIPTGNGGGFTSGTAFLINTNGLRHSVVVGQAGNISIQ